MCSIIAPVVTAILILFLGAFFTPIKKYLFGPTLRIFAFKKVDTDDGCRWHVLVTSTGIFSTERAKGCRVKLTVLPIDQDDILPDNTKLKGINFRNSAVIQSESICWAKEGYPEILDINPSDVEPAELIAFNIDDRKIIIPSEKGWSEEGGLDLIHLKPRDYTFRIVVTAENAHPGWAHFEFRRPVEDESGEGPWLTFCIHRNILWPFRIPPIPGVFDLRLAGIKK